MVEKEVKIKVAIDDGEVKSVEDLITKIANEKITIKAEDAETQEKIDGLKKKLEEVDDEPIKPEFDESSVQLGIQNITAGFDRVKAGAREIKTELSEALESAGKQETNKAFLEQALGDPKVAKQKMQDINSIVQDLPGDDSVMQGLLGQAVAKDASLTTDELTKMGGAASDYFAAMKNYGKSSSEAFQDMNNYLMTGNTAEIERSPILANHIDKLKEGTSIQERSKLLQEALNEEHWGGISAQDTYNNKLETFNGMLERGQYTLGGMFQEGAKGAMDFALQLDEATGGWVGIGLAAAQFASPITDVVSGLGQMATGLKALKDAKGVLGLADKFGKLKDSISTAKDMVNALRDAESISEGVKAALAIATGAESVAEEGNAVAKGTAVGPTSALAVAENSLLLPILLIIGAIVALVAVLWYLYNNNETVRNGIDQLIATVQAFIGNVMEVVGVIVSQVVAVITDIINRFNMIINVIKALMAGNISLEQAIGMVWAIISDTINTYTQAIVGFILNFGTQLVQYVSDAFNNAKLQIMAYVALWKTIAIMKVIDLVNGVINTLTGLPSKIASAISGVANAIAKPFKDAYNMVAKEVEKIKNKAQEVANDPIGALFGSAGITTGSAGISMGSVNGIGSANTNLISNISNATGGRPNIVLNGIIEESAGDFIVRKLSDEIYKQNVLRGVE